jgi:radical SAM protein with 4Fe4S-binding SPASM domain
VIRVDLRDLMLQDQDDNLLDRYYKLDAFAERLRNAHYDVVLNYTHTKTSAALCQVLNVVDTRGVTLDNCGFQVVKNPWLFYFFVSNLNRPYNQFNLVDIYRRSIGGGQSPGSFAYVAKSKGNQEAEELWQKHNIPTDRPIIGFAVGASNHTKRWPPDHFARLAELLSQSHNAHIVILGNKEDKKIARDILLNREELVTDLTAHTSLRGLASVLKRCHVLISNDTGTMHVAAAVGTSTVSLVMGTALGSETAPYHTKGLVIQSLHHCAPCGYTNLCKDAKCRMDITPEAVAASVNVLLPKADTTSIGSPNSQDFERIQVYRGDFDPEGLFDLYPLIRRPLDADSLTDRILRRIWLEFLESPPWDILDNGGIDRWVDRVVDYCRQYFDLRYINELASQYHTADQAQLLKPIPWLDQGIQAAGELIDAAMREPMDIEKITVLGDQLSKIDQQLESVGHTQQVLRAFHIYFNLRKGSLLAHDLEGQARETVDIYRCYRLQLLIADRMIEKIIGKLSELQSEPLKLAVNSPESPDHVNMEIIDRTKITDSQGWEKLRRDLISGMNLRIPIPERLSSHIVQGRTLIIAPEKAAWIVTDSLGACTLHMLKNNQTVGQCVVELVENNGTPADKAIESVKALVANITRQGFRADMPPVETTLEGAQPNLQLFLTRKCNLRCTHCYADAGRALGGEISVADWKQVITEFSAMKAGGVVTFSGGEPLVHPQFHDIARHAKSLDHKVYLLTNGVAIDSLDMAKSLVGVVDSVQLSLEGTAPKIHDPIRGKGSFQRAVKGLEYLLASGFPVEIVFVVLPGNVADLRNNLGDFVERSDSPNLSVALGVVNYNGRAQNTFDDPPESLVGQVVDAYPNAAWLRKGGWVSNRVVQGCPLANSVVVDADGRITTCPYLHYHSPYRMGQMELAQASKFDRAWHAQAIRQNPKCSDCDLRNFPCGGCMVLRSKCSSQIFQRAYYRMVFGR